MNEVFVIDVNLLKKVSDSTLFYPCSGNDLFVPVEIFSPYVTDFVFVDRGYFSPGHCDTRHYGGDVSADQQKPVLHDDKRYSLKNIKIVGPSCWEPYQFDIDPCTLTETYLHISSNREIRIHRRRGYGFSAFRKEISQLGVFFYRGDSAGEGGSGNLWLKEEHIDEVCNKIIDGGLIVSDGSDGARYRRNSGFYREMSKFSWKEVLQSPDEIIKNMNPFEDRSGRRFCCVGYAGMRYGPTMIWQVNKYAK